MRSSVLAALSVILLGFGVPAISVYFTVYHGFNFIVTGIMASLAIIVAGILAVVGMAIGSEELPAESIKPSEKAKLNMLRAHQRATLEELDDIIGVLKEIRDMLKAAQE